MENILVCIYWSRIIKINIDKQALRILIIIIVSHAFAERIFNLLRRKRPTVFFFFYFEIIFTWCASVDSAIMEIPLHANVHARSGSEVTILTAMYGCTVE